MADDQCPDCRSNGDGKCKKCDGSGYVGFYEGATRGLTGADQSCDECHGSGKCQTCDGKGYL